MANSKNEKEINFKLPENNDFQNFQTKFLSKRQLSSHLHDLSIDETPAHQVLPHLIFPLEQVLEHFNQEKSGGQTVKSNDLFLEKSDDINIIDKKLMKTLTEDLSPLSLKKKRQKKVQLEHQVPEKEKLTLASNTPNEKLLENHLKARNSTVIPFVKKFLYKLRNSTSFRDISQLKKGSFQILNDKSYFYQEEKFKTSLTPLKGIDLLGFRVNKIRFALRSRFKKSVSILIFLENHIKVFHPYQNFKILWDIMHLIMIIFWLFYLPMLISFYEANYLSMLILIVSLVFFFCDILINLNSSYFKSGVIEKSRSKIISNYLKKHLIKDIVAIFPLLLDLFIKMHINSPAFNCLEDFNAKRCSMDTADAEDLFFILRKFNIIKLFIYIKLRDFMQIYSRILEKFLIGEKYQNIISLIRLTFISLLVAHFIGCLWHLIADIHSDEKTWLLNKGLEFSPWLQKYLYSIYWSSVTIMTVGYGDIVPQNNLEVIFALMTIIFGCGVYAFNLNSIGMILQDINKENNTFKHNINIINQFMQRKKVNIDLQMRIREYLRFIWKEEKAQNLEEETNIINVLSGNLKEELLLEAYGEILRKYPVFYANFSERALKKVVHFIKDCKFIPEEIIYDEGGAEDPSIYFIMKGAVEIATNNSVLQKENENNENNEKILLKNLKPGDFFGEISFFTGKARLASAKSLDFSTLFSIKRSDFVNILKNNENLIDDYDKFCMIRDQIMLYENYNPLRTRCFSCNQLGHLSNKCGQIHYIPDNEKIIKTHNYQIDQERDSLFLRNSQRISLNAVKNRKLIEKKIDLLNVNMKKAEENFEINRYKNLKCLMRNLTGRIIYEEDSSFDEEDDDDDDDKDEEETLLDQRDFNSSNHLDEANSMQQSEEKEKKTHDFIKNPIENNQFLNKIDNIKEKDKDDDNNKTQPELHDRLSVIKTKNASSNSLILLNDPHNLTYRHSAFAVLGNREETQYSKQKSDFLEENLKKMNQKNELHPNFISKPILKNPTESGGVPSLHSISKMKASLASKTKQGGESSMILPDFSNKKNEENLKQGSSIFSINANIIEEMIKNIECFEKAKNFKNYFPENNLIKLINVINCPETLRRSVQDKMQKQKKLTNRLSKYTFFSQEMRNKMPEIIMKKIRSSKGSKIINNPLNPIDPLMHYPTSYDKKMNMLNSPTNFNNEKKMNNEPPSAGIRSKRMGFFQEMEDNKNMKFLDVVHMMVKDGEAKNKVKKNKSKRKFFK